MTQLWRKLPEMTHEEWLKWRKGGIGSSDAASILKEPTAFGTPYQVWESILFGEEKKANFAMKGGRILEAPARKEFNRLLGVTTESANVENINDPWLRASLDGLDADGKVMVEIKVPGRVDHSIAMNDRVPDKYYIQCQHQLAVTGLPGMYYFSFDGTEGKSVEVIRDETLIKRLFEEEKKFWELVLSETPPPLTEKDYINMENHCEWSELTSRWRELNSTLKSCEQEEKTIRERLRAIAKEKSARGNGITFTKVTCLGNVDYKKAFEEHNIPMEDYRKESYIKWTLRAM